MNRLQYEKSPYLLQHTENPVDWRAWGADALETARREDKPIFLSIGYSTCHWCHVMAHESFESEEVAEALKGVEGKYYVFTTEELTRVLGEDAEVFCERYGVTKGGNFHGKSIPNLIDAMDWDAEVSEPITRKLYDYRKTRAPLHCDDKVLAAWNGLMIASLARAGLTFDEPRYLRTAEKAAVFIRQRMTDAQGRLLSRWRDDEAAHPGKLDDYAFLAWGLLELYGATFDLAYLEDACRLAGILLEQFFDAEHGGFYPYNGSVNPDQGYEKRS